MCTLETSVNVHPLQLQMSIAEAKAAAEAAAQRVVDVANLQWESSSDEDAPAVGGSGAFGKRAAEKAKAAKAAEAKKIAQRAADRDAMKREAKQRAFVRGRAKEAAALMARHTPNTAMGKVWWDKPPNPGECAVASRHQPLALPHLTLTATLSQRVFTRCLWRSFSSASRNCPTRRRCPRTRMRSRKMKKTSSGVSRPGPS